MSAEMETQIKTLIFSRVGGHALPKAFFRLLMGEHVPPPTRGMASEFFVSNGGGSGFPKESAMSYRLKMDIKYKT